MKERIADDIKTALKAGDKSRVGALRLIMAEIKQQEIDRRETLGENEILKILHKLKKQRKESITQYEQAGREDLVKQEQFEMGIIDSYLPEALGETQVDAAIQRAIQQTGAADAKAMGKVMGVLQAELGGRADMAQVSKKVKQYLAG